MEALTRHVHELEAQPGMAGDWTMPGGHTEAAALDVARTTFRRAERALVRLRHAGQTVGPHAVPFVNRLSDRLWLLGRLVEHAAGVDARMRGPDHPGPRWSRAWSGDHES